MATDKLSTPATRRKFIGGAAVAATAAIAAPSVVKAQGPINMRFQSTWPSKDIFHEYALDFGKRVTDMTGGDLKIEVLPAGAVVPAFGLLDAVSKGVLDGGHGVLVYSYGKNTALALWAPAPAMAWTPTCFSPGTSTAAARRCSRRSSRRSAPTSCRSRTRRSTRSRSAGSRSR
jgi:TRAP-type mannitol/chloroaromatic compound transport system substrate-binding protein